MSEFENLSKMSLSRVPIIPLLLVLCFLTIPVISQPTIATTSADSPAPYWYTYEPFTITPDDIWVPFWALSDVPYSHPLRGYNEESRNQFLDFGAVEWLNKWADDVYGWPGSIYESGLLENGTLNQLQFLFETMTSRFAKPHIITLS